MRIGTFNKKLKTEKMNKVNFIENNDGSEK